MLLLYLGFGFNEEILQMSSRIKTKLDGRFLTVSYFRADHCFVKDFFFKQSDCSIDDITSIFYSPLCYCHVISKQSLFLSQYKHQHYVLMTLLVRCTSFVYADASWQFSSSPFEYLWKKPKKMQHVCLELFPSILRFVSLEMTIQYVIPAIINVLWARWVGPFLC